ncbi:hypothetical protein LJR175_008305 [Variovorax sp. LjRoot175]|uniref:hypothetical protein n=1 Tax=Variovorax sp. LjRoot175 TaxID=3342276 RepID=UPI003ED0A9DB
MHATLLRIAALGGCLALAACSTIDPQQVGQGQYMQVMNGTDVLLESDASRAGFQNCANSAYQLMQGNKDLQGRIKCAAEPTTQALPFTYRVRNSKSTAGDHVLPSSAYLVRSRTSVICASSLAATAKEEKTEVFDDRCAGGTASTMPPATASTGGKGRFFNMASEGQLLLQIAMTSEAQCADYFSATRKQLAEAPPATKFDFFCAAGDSSDRLRFKAAIQDDDLGSPLAIAAKTELICLNAVAEIVKIMVPAIQRARYSTTASCSRSN